MNTLLFEELKKVSTPEKAKANAWFFKTGPGEYGEGDQFIGVTVPLQRKVAKSLYKQLTIDEVLQSLQSPWHEERLTALFILVLKYQKGDQIDKDRVADAYLENTEFVNNWDLVDSSAGYILGDWLENSPYKMKVLTKLAKSNDLWERRIAMLSCSNYIGKGRSKEAFEIIEILKNDHHDLIQKAVGWMLREIGKRVNRDELTNFLDKNAATLPRTALRYSIEHLPTEQRKRYLNMR
ncbi:DNA alkylation repair protein [Candidatus Saccharibacteria bacterium]|nr:DNA alkylation repair protein [Candidatus Saccharibacteria bacterium]